MYYGVKTLSTKIHDREFWWKIKYKKQNIKNRKKKHGLLSARRIHPVRNDLSREVKKNHSPATIIEEISNGIHPHSTLQGFLRADNKKHNNKYKKFAAILKEI